MTRRVTPPMNSKGLFEIRKPFTLIPKRVYEVIAIREITDLFTQHVDVYKEYYEHHGISKEDYQLDVDDNVAIVTLIGQDGTHYVPDTYIESYPELGISNYKRIVLSVDLGAVHDSTNLDGVCNDIAEVCSQLLGVKATVRQHTAPVKNVITNDEAKQIETVRDGLKNVPDSSYLQLKKEKEKNALLVEKTNALLLKGRGR